MEKIQSFTVDHNRLKEGLYLSRRDGDAVTYDLRSRRPNAGDYMDHETMHSVEHLAATFLRNGPHRDSILYFGPMGCQTGFYLLVRDLDGDSVKAELIRVMEAIEAYDGPMPGGTQTECGNFRSLSMEKGKAECRRLHAILTQYQGDYSYEA